MCWTKAKTDTNRTHYNSLTLPLWRYVPRICQVAHGGNFTCCSVSQIIFFSMSRCNALGVLDMKAVYEEMEREELVTTYTQKSSAVHFVKHLRRFVGSCAVLRCTRLKGSALHTMLNVMLHIISSIMRTRPLLTPLRLEPTGTQTPPTTSITMFPPTLGLHCTCLSHA